MGSVKSINSHIKISVIKKFHFHVFSYGLDSDNIPRTARSRVAAGGFVDLGNEAEYAVSGHQPSGADEVFATEQGDKPW